MAALRLGGASRPSRCWSFGLRLCSGELLSAAGPAHDPGLRLGGEVPIAATYIDELSSAKGRGRFVPLFELVFPAGILAASVLGLWLVPSFGWQSMFIVGAIPSVLVLFLQRLLPESPRWLAARGRYAEAEAALRVVESGTEKALGPHFRRPRAQRFGVPETVLLVRSVWAALFRRTLVVWVMWFATYFVNYGPGHLDADILPHGVPSAARPPRSPISSSPMWSRFSRELCLRDADRSDGTAALVRGERSCSAAALLALWYIGPYTPERVLVLGTLSNMCVGTMSLAVYLYTPELYPTRSRALGVGTATAWLRLASIIGPNVVGVMVAVRSQFGSSCFGWSGSRLPSSSACSPLKPRGACSRRSRPDRAPAAQKASPL